MLAERLVFPGSSLLAERHSVVVERTGINMARNEVVENAVEYRLFPRLPDHLAASEREAYLETIQDSYLAYLGSDVVDYIWQIDPFQLRIIPTSTGKV